MTLMVLDSLNAAAFTLSAKFSVLAMNRRAQALLAQGKGFLLTKIGWLPGEPEIPS
jgi:hypothetical protein